MNVFWTRASRRVGDTLFVGVGVARPGWVAFLPLYGATGSAAQAQLGFQSGAVAVGGVAPNMNVAWQGKYPLAAWWQHGEQAFDHETARAAQQPGGILLRTLDAECAHNKQGAYFEPIAEPGTTVHFTQVPPPPLLQGYPLGVPAWEQKGTQKGFVILSLAMLALTGSCSGVVLASDEPPWTVVFAGLWLLFIPFAWIMYALRAREHRAAIAARDAQRVQRGAYR